MQWLVRSTMVGAHIACLAAVAAAQPAAATASPERDFIGTWRLAEPALPPPGVSTRLVVRQPAGGRQLQVLRDPSGPATPPETYDVNPPSTAPAAPAARDGRRVNPPGGQPSETSTSMEWKTNRLTLHRTTSVSREPGRTVTTTRDEIWTVDAQGLLAIDLTEQETGGPAHHLTLKYRRVEP